MNTRHRTRAFFTGIAAPLCLTAALHSTATLADSRTQAAMDACVKAFVATSLAKDRQIALRIEAPTSSSLLPRARPYAIALTATGRDSGKQLAKATCRTDRNGAVLALNGKPMPSLASADAKASLTAED